MLRWRPRCPSLSPCAGVSLGYGRDGQTRDVAAEILETFGRESARLRPDCKHCCTHTVGRTWQGRIGVGEIALILVRTIDARQTDCAAGGQLFLDVVMTAWDCHPDCSSCTGCSAVLSCFSNMGWSAITSFPSHRAAGPRILANQSFVLQQY